MSDCGNCDCPDKSHCPKKQGFQVDGIAETSFNDTRLPGEVCGTVILENDCKCGPNCKCNTCPCHR